MNAACAFAGDQGVIRNMLMAVECNTREFAQLGYLSLTGSGSWFQTALTLVLTIYVAIIGYRLLFASGEARLAQGPVTALKIGAVLALVTNWNAFQTIVFDVASRAPVEIAALVSAPLQIESSLASAPLDGLQIVYDQLSLSAAAFAEAGAQNASETEGLNAAIGNSEAAETLGNVAQTLTIAANALLITNAGLIAVATISVGLLTAIGPIFIVLFLFLETRGLFTGWVRALVASSFVILTTWTLTVLMLHVIEPWLVELADQRQFGGLPDAQLAMSAVAIVLVFAASQAGLVLAGFMIARGFNLGGAWRTQPLTGRTLAAGTRSTTPLEMVSRSARLGEQLQKFDARYALPSASLVGATSSGARPDNVSRASRNGQTVLSGTNYRRSAVRAETFKRRERFT
jgi:type IV secretion system protein VirB6